MAADSVSQALQMAAREAKGGTIVVSGSVYLVGEARSLLLRPGGIGEEVWLMSARPNPLPRLLSLAHQRGAHSAHDDRHDCVGTISLAVSLVDKRAVRSTELHASGPAALVFCRRLFAHSAWRGETAKHPVAVYASNHTSYMDTPVIFACVALPVPHSGEEGIVAYRVHWMVLRSIRTDSDRHREPARPRSQAWACGVKALRSGMPLFVFPEGGRTPNGELQNFLSGAAYLAIRAQVPLVPIALSGVYDLLPIHARHLFPGELTLTAGEPIDTTGMTIRQTDELTARLRAAIQALQARRAAGRAEVQSLKADSCAADACFADAAPIALRVLTLIVCMSVHIAIPEPTSSDTAYNQRSLPPYLAALHSAGATPILVPLHERQDRVARLLAGVQGILLPGSGFDVDPQRYGEDRNPRMRRSRPGPDRGG